MFSPTNSQNSQDSRIRSHLIWHCLYSFVALVIIFASPKAFGQVTSKESKPKTASQTNSSTASKAKSKISSESKSQARGKAESEKSSQARSQTTSKEKSGGASQAKSQTANEEKSEESNQARPQTANEEKSAGSGEPKSEASSETAPASPSPSPAAAEVSSLKPEDLRGFYNNPPEVQELLTAALGLTQRGLGYLYGSADPERGGMDCSGTIYFLLQKMGVTDVPRSASQQYVWVRKSDAFRPVVSTRLDSFELDALRPGNLLFWTGTYSTEVDPPVTHTMIYLGKARSDGRPLMVGASDGRTFRGDKKSGVSVFDFVIPKPDGRSPMSRFIGYGEIPR